MSPKGPKAVEAMEPFIAPGPDLLMVIHLSAARRRRDHTGDDYVDLECHAYTHWLDRIVDAGLGSLEGNDHGQ